MMPYLHDDMILTDVGSVKTPIHDEIIRLGLEDYFIGGHPMAGSEKSGFANSKPILIENAYFVLTPSAKVAKKKVDAYASFVHFQSYWIIMNTTSSPARSATCHISLPQVWSTLSETPTPRMS